MRWAERLRLQDESRFLLRSDARHRSGEKSVTMTHPVLAADQLTKAYASTYALNGVSLTVHSGESAAIMGPSGSGKTTLMHLLSGILTPDAGEVRFRTGAGILTVSGMSSEKRAQLRRQRIGFVFQEGLLLPELTAQENVAMPLMLNGAGRHQAQQRADEWLGSLGLTGMEQRRPGELSGGQQQRVAIARMLMQKPRVVLADEPVAALDPRAGRAVMDLLWEVTEEQGLTMICTLHQLALARDYGSRLVALRDGRIDMDTQMSGVADEELEGLYTAEDEVMYAH